MGVDMHARTHAHTLGVAAWSMRMGEEREQTRGRRVEDTSEEGGEKERETQREIWLIKWKSTTATQLHANVCIFSIFSTVNNLAQMNCYHTCVLYRIIHRQTFRYYSITEVVSLNHTLRSFISLCAGIRRVNLSVSAVCHHLSEVGLLFSPPSH